MSKRGRQRLAAVVAVLFLLTTLDAVSVGARTAPGVAFAPATEPTDRRPLNGAVVSGDIVVTAVSPDRYPIRFFIDDPRGAGSPISTVAASAGLRIKTKRLKDGVHSLRVESRKSAAVSVVRFTVNNGSGATAESAGGLPAITTEGSQIKRGGKPWWFVGSNSFVWSGDCGDPEEKMTPSMVDKWFSSMRHDGHGAVRLFFYDGWSDQALDRAVAAARRNNVYLMITLDDAIGGCGASKKDGAWFSDANATTRYERHMTRMVTKLKGETAVAWFEYFNEPTDTAGELRAFYDRMGAKAKTLDPDRLWATGTQAPYATAGAKGFATLNASPGVDIVSMHEYDENEIASNHTAESVANSAGKPMIVGEFGIKASATGDGCVSFSERARRYRAKLNAYLRTPGVVGALAWAHQPGNGATECEYGNLDADRASRRVIDNIRR